MQFHPFSISPLVYSGKGGGGDDETKKKREGSPLIKLELDVGGFGGQSCVIKQEGESILFTAAQFHELYQQVVIFKYLSAGLAVPFHLVHPIWKSVSTGFGPQEFVHRSIMDSEPGRCRRTDGKKWRCYGSVVPNQKYCERHMHRGSQRSRKLVEASKDFLKSNTEHLIPDKSRSSIISSRTVASNGRISVPVSTTLDLAAPSASVEVGISSISYKSNSEGSSTDVAQVDRGAAKSSLLTRNESHWNDSLGNRNSAKPSIAAELGVSPKSVLQGGIGRDYRKLSFDNKTGMAAEALRCRRTDGKRWRCSRDVVPDKKYCENHLHRGAKKPMVDSRLITGAPRASSVHKAATYIMPKKVKKYQVLDTNLSMSIATSTPQMFDSDSSSSDATTVSDENVQFHRL